MHSESRMPALLPLLVGSVSRDLYVRLMETIIDKGCQAIRLLYNNTQIACSDSGHCKP